MCDESSHVLRTIAGCLIDKHDHFDRQPLKGISGAQRPDDQTS